ncbi:Ada metal-binding domain-containing protein [Microtetraspora malaysiensis]|uniref:Ada metal-binding domain-containing protein n=1 Tax=Microtetraspora malaysiensis TaxID=161358 RepID=UPI003D93B19B
MTDHDTSGTDEIAGAPAGAGKVYTLLDADRRPYSSTMPGKLGGHSSSKVYGRLNCPAALRVMAKGMYVKHRVFFADEATAIAAGYRPCGTCLPEKYQAWKREHR